MRLLTSLTRVLSPLWRPVRRCQAWLEERLGPRTRYLLLTMALMLGLYSVLYHPYEAGSVPARLLHAYLVQTAEASARVLGWLGERVSVKDTQVVGRFPYVVVLDCAALDAQALFAAAVLAFPTAVWKRLTGVAVGLLAIYGINISRLVLLYFAGVKSRNLFHVLHEEVMVFAVIFLVCLLFLGWALWVQRGGASPEEGTAHAA